MFLKLPRSYAVIFNICRALRAEINGVEATPSDNVFDGGRVTYKDVA